MYILKKKFAHLPNHLVFPLFFKSCRTDTVSLQIGVKESDSLVILMRQHRTLLFNMHNFKMISHLLQLKQVTINSVNTFE